jgi:hypothetical protein
MNGEGIMDEAKIARIAHRMTARIPWRDSDYEDMDDVAGDAIAKMGKDTKSIIMRMVEVAGDLEPDFQYAGSDSDARACKKAEQSAGKHAQMVEKGLAGLQQDRRELMALIEKLSDLWKHAGYSKNWDNG